MIPDRAIDQVFATLDDLTRGEALAHELRKAGGVLPDVIRDGLYPASTDGGAVAALRADLGRLRDLRDALRDFHTDLGAYAPPTGHTGPVTALWGRVSQYLGHNDDE